MAHANLESERVLGTYVVASHQEAIRAIEVRLVFPAQLWQQLRAACMDSAETAGIAFANRVEREGRSRQLVRELRFAKPGDYQRRGPSGAVLTPNFVANTVREARDAKLATVFFHTHPGELHADFSSIDDSGEQVLQSFLTRRTPGVQHVALVLGAAGQTARLLGTRDRIGISVVGSDVRDLDSEVSENDASYTEEFDRQVRAIGPRAQRRLGNLQIGIVGLGGTGSIATEQLAHLGVTDFLLVDPDVIERSNLNRVVGASPGDVSRPKVDVAADLVRRIRPGAKIKQRRASILQNDVLAELGRVDAVFCCTDSHGSRYVLNEFAYRFLVPCFDCGVVLVPGQGGITHISVRVQMLSPGLSCLTCGRTLDPEQVRRDLLTDFERARDPYIQGASVPEPAVISLNGVAVSLSITMFLGAFCGFPASSRHQRYDAIRGVVRTIDTTPLANCITCSGSGALAAGMSWPLPGRS